MTLEKFTLILNNINEKLDDGKKSRKSIHGKINNIEIQISDISNIKKDVEKLEVQVEKNTKKIVQREAQLLMLVGIVSICGTIIISILSKHIKF
ncbi:MAG: hypothetical protein GY870_14950 [archaeon]|nr:hypothetical protein [archaeon]